MTSSVFTRITFSIGALQMRQHPSPGHNTNHSTAPFCTYVNSYGPLRQIHCLIAKGKCIQMFCFRCVTDLIKRLWIYLLGLKKIISSMYYPIITSITCYVLIGELLISIFKGPGLIFRSPIYKSFSDLACCLAWGDNSRALKSLTQHACSISWMERGWRMASSSSSYVKPSLSFIC